MIENWEIKEVVARLLWARPEELSSAASFAKELIGRISGTPGGHEHLIGEKRAKFFATFQESLDEYKRERRDITVQEALRKEIDKVSAISGDSLLEPTVRFMASRTAKDLIELRCSLTLSQLAKEV